MQKEAEAILPTLYKAIDKAAKRNSKENTAARMKSRAAKQLRALAG